MGMAARQTRLLFAAAGGSGHVEPLLPLARATAERGHAVAFAVRPWMVAQVEIAGFAAFPAGADEGLRPVRRPLAPVDLDKEMRRFGSGFGGRIARERARDLLPLCATWQPDLIVCEETDFGAMLVAERCQIPHATVAVIAAGGFIRPGDVAGPLDEVRVAFDLPPDSGLTSPGRYLFLSPFPPSYRNTVDPWPAATHFYRVPAMAGELPNHLQAWLKRREARPLIYFTLGTVFPLESGDLFARVLHALCDLPVDAVVTVGRDLDPGELGPQPEHLYITRVVPQNALLPHCNLVICHGGSGSVLGAMRHGLPMVLLPMGADQPRNGARCAELGLGLTLDPLAASREEIRRAAAAGLNDGRFRSAAQRMQAEIAALPGVERALERLEELAGAGTKGDVCGTI
jgi:UDP:flavonoid glycosyltransferase YjiC (YdhE family)